jgi:maleate cis-trans isomerase
LAPYSGRSCSSGFEVVSCGRLDNVGDTFEPRRAYELGRCVDTPMAQALLLSGTGMPFAILARLEQDLGMP